VYTYFLNEFFVAAQKLIATYEAGPDGIVTEIFYFLAGALGNKFFPPFHCIVYVDP
jgi:hypothetical protein